VVDYEIEIYKGRDFDLTFQWLDPEDTPIDVTGYRARVEIKDEFNPSIIRVIFDSESVEKDGTIEITGTEGKFRLLMTAEKSVDMQWKKGRYDFYLEDPSGNHPHFIGPAKASLISTVTNV
jgi:hypothetical protein